MTGAAAALRGVPGPVADVDVLCGVGDARRLFGAAAATGAPHPRYRSAVFGTLDGLPLPVEVMAGFEVHGGDGWRPVTLATSEAVVVAGATLYLPGRDELATLFDRIGRDKDRRRAALLRS